ncbi:hypothetical protein Tco_1254802 [Tanacetum coccineum]
MAEEVGVEMEEEASNVKGKEEVLVLTLELAKEKGDGFIVDGGRSPSILNKDGKDGGVENKSSQEQELIFIGYSGGEVMGEVSGASNVQSDGEENGIVKKGKTQEVGVKKSKDCALFIEKDLS